MNLTLERSTGERYDVALPYRDGCRSLRFAGSYPGFVQVMNRENFNVLIDRSRRITLLQWRRFDTDELTKDIPALLEYAEREEILDYAMIIDVSLSGGGSGGAYAIQRLVDQPFRPTFGNVRLSDLGKARIQRYVNREPVVDAPDIFGLNLGRSWLYDWARTDPAKLFGVATNIHRRFRSNSLTYPRIPTAFCNPLPYTSVAQWPSSTAVYGVVRTWTNLWRCWLIMIWRSS